MAADEESTRSSEDEARRLAEDAHLLDLGNLQEVALWILSAAGAGAIGNTVYDVLKAVRKRFGGRRLDELRDRVYQEIREVQRNKRHLSARDLRLRVDRLFADFDS